MKEFLFELQSITTTTVEILATKTPSVSTPKVDKVFPFVNQVYT